MSAEIAVRRAALRRASIAMLWAVLQATSTLAPAADLPRVFFSPAERAAITRDRLAGRSMARAAEPGTGQRRGSEVADAAATSDAAPAVAAGPAAVPAPAADEPAGSNARVARVEGVTVGRGSARAVWIDGERIADGARWRGYRVQVTADGARLVAADGSVRSVRVGMEILR